mmetsp:Transcript_30377/g.91977  ORF Transcript_30377/g.91977 Transcript_30377/m.91977 type:complete len:377 (-) Transcript_30377:464-1594(-)
MPNRLGPAATLLRHHGGHLRGAGGRRRELRARPVRRPVLRSHRGLLLDDDGGQALGAEVRGGFDGRPDDDGHPDLPGHLGDRCLGAPSQLVAPHCGGHRQDIRLAFRPDRVRARIREIRHARRVVLCLQERGADARVVARVVLLHLRGRRVAFRGLADGGRRSRGRHRACDFPVQRRVQREDQVHPGFLLHSLLRRHGHDAPTPQAARRPGVRVDERDARGVPLGRLLPAVHALRRRLARRDNRDDQHLANRRVRSGDLLAWRAARAHRRGDARDRHFHVRPHCHRHFPDDTEQFRLVQEGRRLPGQAKGRRGRGCRGHRPSRERRGRPGHRARRLLQDRVHVVRRVRDQDARAVEGFPRGGLQQDGVGEVGQSGH